MNYIAKFNPYSMDDETILAVATGRKRLLSQVLKTLKGNLKSSAIAQHLLICGPRGMGKSFFLKYLQINFKLKKEFKNSELVLLPEEQNNINSPSDLIKLILSQLKGESGEDTTTFWEEPEEIWQIELKKLQNHIKEKTALGDYALVVVLENLDEFLRNIQNDKKTSKVYESRFRNLLENVKHLTIIGATPSIDTDSIDGNYNNRLFHAFKKCPLTRWGEEEYFDYFERRKTALEEASGTAFTIEQTITMRAKLKALSLFTGGSPRMAVVLTNLLLKEDVITTANTLLGLIDDLTPYYQDLTKSIPPKSKIIFDTLIRKGENLSQSEVAKIVGATQGKIAKAFQWLKDNGYIEGKKRSDSPAFSYKVIDRIHVLYYQLREIHHNQNMTPIWLLSDFLVVFYREHELRKHAHKSLLEQPGRNANDLARVYMVSAGFLGKDEVPEWETTEEWLKAIEDIPEQNERINELLKEIEGYLGRENKEEFFEEFKRKVEELFLLFEGIGNLEVLCKYLERVTHLTHALRGVKVSLKFQILLLIELANVLQRHNFAQVISIYGDIGMYFRSDKKYNKAIQYHKMAIQQIELGQIIGADKMVLAVEQYKAYHVAQMCCNYILLEKWNEVEKIVANMFDVSNTVFTYLAMFIKDIELNEGIAKAFEVSLRILHIFKKMYKKPIVIAIVNMFLVWLKKDGLSWALLKDISDEILVLFPEIENRLYLNTISHTINYLKTNKSPIYLEKLDPDMTITVQSLVRLANL